MRSVLLLLSALLLGAGGASATPEDLSNGVFIAHHAPNLQYSDPPPGGWCEALEQSEYAIDGCADQINRLDGAGDHLMWFIICAWDEDKEWCTTQMGIEGYNWDVWQFQSNGPCYPGYGTGIEIYTNNFPHGDPPGGPSGVTFTPADGNWGPANFEQVWWFEGYAYGHNYGTTLIPLDVDPSTGLGGWVNCESPPSEFAATEFGAMGVNTDGVYCCPMEEEYFACCFEDGTCMLMSEEICEIAGGFSLPEYDYCEPNPCVTHFVCCFNDGGCESDLDEVECLELGGEWYPTGAEGADCDPNPCPPVGTDRPSWGSIKAMYR
jgi:hypothetical protein